MSFCMPFPFLKTNSFGVLNLDLQKQVGLLGDFVYFFSDVDNFLSFATQRRTTFSFTLSGANGVNAANVDNPGRRNETVLGPTPSMQKFKPAERNLFLFYLIHDPWKVHDFEGKKAPWRPSHRGSGPWESLQSGDTPMEALTLILTKEWGFFAKRKNHGFVQVCAWWRKSTGRRKPNPRLLTKHWRCIRMAPRVTRPCSTGKGKYTVDPGRLKSKSARSSAREVSGWLLPLFLPLLVQTTLKTDFGKWDEEIEVQIEGPCWGCWTACS